MYLRPRPDRNPDAYKLPETEDDVRVWCASAAAQLGIPPAEMEEWTEKAVAEFRREQEEKARGASAAE